jgi:hypothetical protein
MSYYNLHECRQITNDHFFKSQSLERLCLTPLYPATICLGWPKIRPQNTKFCAWINEDIAKLSYVLCDYSCTFLNSANFFLEKCLGQSQIHEGMAGAINSNQTADQYYKNKRYMKQILKITIIHQHTQLTTDGAYFHFTSCNFKTFWSPLWRDQPHWICSVDFFASRGMPQNKGQLSSFSFRIVILKN